MTTTRRKGARRARPRMPGPLSLPRQRAPFEAELRSWAGFLYPAPGAAAERLASHQEGALTVAWEYESDDSPSAAQGVAYDMLKEREQVIALAILRALVRERARVVPETMSPKDDLESLRGELSAILGAPRIFLLEEEQDGVGLLGFLLPCAWGRRDTVEVVVHRAKVMRVGPLDAGADVRRQVVTGELDAIDALVGAAMLAGDLSVAAEHAARYAALRRPSRWYPVPRPDDPARHESGRDAPILTPSKLAHDIEQLRYMEQVGVLEKDLAPVIGDFEKVLGDIAPLGDSARVPMDDAARARIGHVYKRIVHVRSAPRVGRALGSTWSPSDVEQAYLAKEPNLIVLDRFLADDAISSLRQFCLESTIWSTNRYGHGRLGSFFRDGFNCPLLIQIAEELRTAMPRMIGLRHPLRQMWGFKCATRQPRLPAHADFAAVNVNFWITPDESNKDPSSGGMLLYDVKAPGDWDFDTYNRNGERIQALLAERGARATYIPYRCNRAVIFDSDLFHTTSDVTFADGYEHRRINVTLLFGDRSSVSERAPTVAPRSGARSPHG